METMGRWRSQDDCKMVLIRREMARRRRRRRRRRRQQQAGRCRIDAECGKHSR